MKSFYSIPVSVLDATHEFHVFSILVPVKYNQTDIHSIIHIVNEFQKVYYNEKHIDRFVSQFFNDLPYQSFNYIHILDTDIDNPRISSGLISVKVGNTVFSGNQFDKSDGYTLCMEIMSVFIT